MTVRINILCLIFLIFSSIAYGQKEAKKKFSKSRQISNTELLQQAREIRKKSPKEAISIIERVIGNKKKSRNEEGQAYALLGNIYEDIGQQQLALQRYEQALKVLSRSKGLSPTAAVHQKMGQIHLNQKTDIEAEYHFKLCIENSENEKLTITCEEGIADVELLRGNIDESLKKLDYVENNYKLDSISTARIAAARSRNYVQQKDYPRATESYYNSVQNLPKNQEINEEDYAPIQQAQDDILNYKETTSAEKIELQTNTANLNVQNKQSSELLVKENLKIAGLFEKEDNLPEAEKFLIKSKASIDKNTKAASVADVYKKSYEINRKKGAMDAAMADLENYILAKEEAISNLQNDLKEQIEIVKRPATN